LEVSINGKQDFINDNDLSIFKTLGLQDALNSKQATITNSSLSIARTIGLQDALNGKQATLIEGNNIIISNNTISSTGSGITQEELDLKQDTLTLNSNLSKNSLNLNADPGLISLTANSLATFDAVRIDTELMCHANDIFLEQD
jgi:hypothetical protein